MQRPRRRRKGARRREKTKWEPRRRPLLRRKHWREGGEGGREGKSVLVYPPLSPPSLLFPPHLARCSPALLPTTTKKTSTCVSRPRKQSSFLPSLPPSLPPPPSLTLPAFSRTTFDDDQKVHVRVRARESDNPSMKREMTSSILREGGREGREGGREGERVRICTSHTG